MIIRSVKAANISEQLNKMSKIAKKLNINSIEIQELYNINKTISLKKRIDNLKKTNFKIIYFHFVLPVFFYDFELVYPFDLTKCNINPKDKDKIQENLIFKLTKETIKTAGIIGNIKDQEETPIVVHFFGISRKPSIKQKLFYLKKAEIVLKKLEEYAREISLLYSTNVIISRENNPPHTSNVNFLLDFDFRDMINKNFQTKNITFDFAHFWMYYLYSRFNKREFKGPNVSLKQYNGFDIKENLNLVKDHIKVLHLNDSGPSYFSRDEGKTIGTGNIDFELIFNFFKKIFKRKTIFGTYEIKDHHIKPDVIIKSDEYLRQFDFYNELFL